MDVSARRDALVDIFDRIEGFFRRLETYSEVPTTEAMRVIIVTIFVEVLGIFAIVTREIKRKSSSEQTPDNTFSITDQDLDKFSMEVMGRTDVEVAMNRLDKLTGEEFQMAVAQVFKVTQDVGEGVKKNVDGGGVSVKADGLGVHVKDVDDKVDVVVEGTFSTHKRNLKPICD